MGPGEFFVIETLEVTTYKTSGPTEHFGIVGNLSHSLFADLNYVLYESRPSVCIFEFHGTWILSGILGFDTDSHDFTDIFNKFYMNFILILPTSSNAAS